MKLIRRPACGFRAPWETPSELWAGLIIGQAAVQANRKPHWCIVAFTALGSLAVPSEEFASAFRLLKYLFLFLGGYLGFFEIVLGGYVTLSHLAGLLSFGAPYLASFIREKGEHGVGNGDCRLPFRMRRKAAPVRKTGGKPAAEKEGRDMKIAENNRISHRQLYRQMILAFTAPFLLCCFPEGSFWASAIAGTAAAVAVLLFDAIFLIRLTPSCSNLVKRQAVSGEE